MTMADVFGETECLDEETGVKGSECKKKGSNCDEGRNGHVGIGEFTKREKNQPNITKGIPGLLIIAARPFEREYHFPFKEKLADRGGRVFRSSPQIVEFSFHCGLTKYVIPIGFDTRFTDLLELQFVSLFRHELLSREPSLSRQKAYLKKSIIDLQKFDKILDWWRFSGLGLLRYTIK
jgi:hypothetical protein